MTISFGYAFITQEQAKAAGIPVPCWLAPWLGAMPCLWPIMTIRDGRSTTTFRLTPRKEKPRCWYARSSN